MVWRKRDTLAATVNCSQGNVGMDIAFERFTQTFSAISICVGPHGWVPNIKPKNKAVRKWCQTNIAVKEKREKSDFDLYLLILNYTIVSRKHGLPPVLIFCTLQTRTPVLGQTRNSEIGSCVLPLMQQISTINWVMRDYQPRQTQVSPNLSGKENSVHCFDQEGSETHSRLRCGPRYSTSRVKGLAAHC